ncbi:MAG: alkaline phosphatase family protein [Acidimicrobiia bacterium]
MPGARRNVLLITVDQWRGDCLGCFGHPVVRTPNLDALAAEGVAFRRHYAQAAPCGPSRASLHTGQYLMKHRSALNGTPLDARFTNLALEARAAGYDPVLFGYTDASPDPRVLAPDDPRLLTYEGVLPGFRAVVDLPEHLAMWGEWLRRQGYDVPGDVRAMYTAVSDAPGAPVAYAAEHSEAAYLTGEILDHVGNASGPWFVHAAYIRPHPPFVAPAPYASMYDPGNVPLPVRAPTPEAEGVVHPVLAGAVAIPGVRLGDDLDELRQTRATYYGMMSEVDAQLGRLFDGLRERGVWDDTLVVLTSDHGEQLGDHWLTEKLGWFEQSYHIPLIVRDPDHHETRGEVVADHFTENVDVMPTILEWLGLPAPVQCDGRSLLDFVRGRTPQRWRDAAFWEWEFRDPIGGWAESMLGLTMDQCGLSVLRDAHGKYVHFTGLPALFYDLDDDPDELVNRADDAAYTATVLSYAQRMLSHRMEHVEQTLTGLVVTPAGVLDGRRHR